MIYSTNISKSIYALILFMLSNIYINEVLAQCTAPAGCDASCPSVCVSDATLAGIAGGLCLGGTTQLLCLDWNGQGDPSTITLDYSLTPSLGETVALVGNAAGDQVCIEVTTPEATDCNITETQLAINAITPSGGCTLGYDLNISQPLAVSEQGCDINTGTIFGFLDLLTTLNGQLPPLTVYPSYEVIVTDPVCDGDNGSAVLSVNGTECTSTAGTAGISNACPSTTDTDGTLVYDFSTFSIGALADGTQITITEAAAASCVTGNVSDNITVDCLMSCASCPTVTAVGASATEFCHNAAVTICVDFDAAADDVTVNGASVAVAGDTQICYDVTANNMACASADETNTPTVMCTLTNMPIAIPNDAMWTTYPMLTEIITAPDCSGGAGSAVLMAGDGTMCQNIPGVAGTPNVCPATDDVDATLTYDFTSFNDPIGCFVGTSGIAPIDCAVACAVCTVDVSAAPAAPIVTESVCEADDVTLSGGIIDYSGVVCPAGSTLQYSDDNGVTWGITTIDYNQTDAITVSVRCLCDEDMVTVSPITSITTVPDVCPTCTADLSVAPAAPIVTESICEADNATLSGGVIDYSGTSCPTGSAIEYSTDGGLNWGSVAPSYDQMNSVTVDIRCLCDFEGTTSSVTTISTVPGICIPCDASHGTISIKSVSGGN